MRGQTLGIVVTVTTQTNVWDAEGHECFGDGGGECEDGDNAWTMKKTRMKTMSATLAAGPGRSP